MSNKNIYICQKETWPDLWWDRSQVAKALHRAARASGFLAGFKRSFSKDQALEAEIRILKP